VGGRTNEVTVAVAGRYQSSPAKVAVYVAVVFGW
jgi:hypothetical protein